MHRAAVTAKGGRHGVPIQRGRRANHQEPYRHCPAAEIAAVRDALSHRAPPTRNGTVLGSRSTARMGEMTDLLEGRGRLRQGTSIFADSPGDRVRSTISTKKREAEDFARHPLPSIRTYSSVLWECAAAELLCPLIPPGGISRKTRGSRVLILCCYLEALGRMTNGHP